MIIISSDKQYRHNKNVIFAEPNVYRSYENMLDGDNSFEYKYFYDRELSQQQVIEILEQTEQPIFFDSFVVLDKLMTKKVFEKLILAPFVWKDITKSQANNLFTGVDMYATINDLENNLKLAKREKVWKELDSEELQQKIEKCIYVVDFKPTEDEIEIIFGIHNVYEINRLQILNNGEVVKFEYHPRANRLNNKKDLVMYSFRIDANKISKISATYAKCKLQVIKAASVKKNTKGLYNFASDKYIAFDKPNMLYLPKLSFRSKIKRELRYLKNCRNRSTIKNRLLIFATKPFITDNKILISDRVSFAKDNGEEFYRYLMENNVKHIYYILSSDSPDYDRLKAEGFKIIKQNSFRHMLYLYNYRLLCTSNMTISRFHYFSNKDYQNYADIATGSKVFLQHGTAYNDLSKIYSDYRVDIDEFVCSAQAEYDFLTKLDFRDNLIFTGAPRFDRLHKTTEKNYILAFFTWRDSIKSMYSNELITDFEQTTYFKAINRLLTDQEIIDKLEQSNLELKLFLHPNIQEQAEYFEKQTKHQVCSGLNGDISELIHSSKMLITDYSSVACDFAYQHKPVIAYQFDREEFHYETGIDLEQHNVISSYEQYDQAKQAILNCIDNQFQLSSEQLKGIDEFFGYRDDQNNERLYEYLSSKYL